MALQNGECDTPCPSTLHVSNAIAGPRSTLGIRCSCVDVLGAFLQFLSCVYLFAFHSCDNVNYVHNVRTVSACMLCLFASRNHCSFALRLLELMTWNRVIFVPVLSVKTNSTIKNESVTRKKQMRHSGQTGYSRHRIIQNLQNF